MKMIDENKMQMYLQLHDKRIITSDEILVYVIDKNGDITFPRCNFHVSDNYGAVVQQLSDRMIVTKDQVRKYFGFN